MPRTHSKYNDPEYVGQKFWGVEVIDVVHGNNRWLWKCRCKCGKEWMLSPYKLITGHTKSCGCGKIERCHKLTEQYRTTHGGRNERLYYIWRGMKARCENEQSKDYANWGGRGIEICDAWKHDYSEFRSWAQENGYADGLTIDRTDNDGNYCPENCRWISPLEQSKNRRTTHSIKYGGETKTIGEWANILGVKYVTLYARLKHNNWDAEVVFPYYLEESI